MNWIVNWEFKLVFTLQGIGTYIIINKYKTMNFFLLRLTRYFKMYVSGKNKVYILESAVAKATNIPRQICPIMFWKISSIFIWISKTEEKKILALFIYFRCPLKATLNKTHLEYACLDMRALEGPRGPQDTSYGPNCLIWRMDLLY